MASANTDLESLLKELLMDNTLLEGTVSNPREKSLPFKVKIRPVGLAKGPAYQITEYLDTKVLHFNLTAEKSVERLLKALQSDYKQALFQAKEASFHILMDKKKNAKIIERKVPAIPLSLSHNKTKRYLLEEGIPVPFLVALDVMDKEGKVFYGKRDKFRQINRYLEMVQDILSALDPSKTIEIIDFGSGKAYLTFALYHFLHDVKKYPVRILGLDLKSDVVAFANDLSSKLQMEHLKFEVGDIHHYAPKNKVDMIVSLHACDTATDAAIEKGIRWEAEVILAVPCCQKELHSQVKNNELLSLLRHGILKERFSALATDAIRAEMLEMNGYKTQILEFIDLEHTPKNLLIRAVKRKGPAELQKVSATERYYLFKKLLNVNPILESFLTD